MSRKTDPQLVAHRGYSSHFPENTLLAFEQALIAGACFVECDVQLTLNGVPVLLHDVELQRTSSGSGNVNELTLEQLGGVRAGFNSRFGSAFNEEPLPTLEQLVNLMMQWPKRRVFVEVKRATLERFGADLVLEKISEVTEKIISQVTIISFDSKFIELVQKTTKYQTGWVIDKWDQQNLEIANQMQPGFLFVDYECIPQEMTDLPAAGWTWVLYEIDDALLASQWVQQGADFIETNDIGNLLDSTEFQNSRCHG